MVDPELRDGRDENEDAEKELFGRLFLLTRENQSSQTNHESEQKNGANDPPRLKSLKKITLLDGAAAFSAIQSLSYKSPTSK
jgi:hypothetical protein